MSDNLWVDIDDYLEAAVLADMGPGNGNGYTALLVPDADSVVVGDAYDPDLVTVPFVLIRGVRAIYSEDGPHGDGEVHIDTITYPYELFGVIENATYAGAKADVQEMLRRLREVVRSRYALGGLVADDGEFVRETQFGQGEIEVSGFGDTNRGAYLGGCVLDVNIISEI